MNDEQRDDQTGAEAGLRAALEAYHSGSLELAEASCRRVLTDHPSHPSALYFLGVVLHGRGDTCAGVASLRRSLELEPGNPEAHANLGNLLQTDGQLEEAVAAYERSLELEDDAGVVWNNLAAALGKLGRSREAIEALERAAELVPGSAELRVNLANALSDAGEPEAALAACRKALGLNPRLASAHHNLGVLLRERGELEAAIAAFADAIDCRPDYAEAHNNLGSALIETGREDEAVRALERGLAASPRHARLHYNLGFVLARLGRSQEALDALRAALEKDPGYDRAWDSLGRTLFGLGREDEALALYREWLEHDPENPIARHMVAAASSEEIPDRASDEYVKRWFDRFSESFDSTLERLDYRAPTIVAEKVDSLALGRDLDVLDAGCGTGLCGPLLRARAARLTGVDLSAGMLEKARPRGAYDELIEAELTAYLSAEPARFDLIVSADTFNYFGVLEPLFEVAATALRPGATLVFTLEEASEGTYGMESHGRYAHSEAYLREALASAGLELVQLDRAVLRMEAGQEARGFVVVARR